VEFYDARRNDGTITFQAVLGADGSITLSYSDLQSDYEGAEGASATIGIKDTWFFGHRILLCYNSGPGEFVETGKSTHLVRPPVGQHAVTLDAGEIETGVLFGARRDAPPGDVDGDGEVDNGDVALFTDQFGMRGEDLSADFNGDGNVDLSDFSILRASLANPLIASRAQSTPAAVAVSNPAVPGAPRAGETPSEKRPLKSQTSRAEPDRPSTTQTGQASLNSLDTEDPPARTNLPDSVSGWVSIAGGRVDTPTARTVWYPFDRSNSGPGADVTDKLFGIDDLLDGVLVDVLDGPLV